jgi:uncharacterized protein YabE (DUF348 family)
MSLPRQVRLLLIVLACLAVVCLALLLGLRKTVTLNADGSTRTVKTYAFTVGGLLREQGLALSPSDSLSPPLNAWLKNRATLTLVRAIPVQIMADGKISSIITSQRVPGAILEQAGIQLNPGDQLLSDGQPVAPDQPLPPSLVAISLQLVRRVSFTLTENGETRVLYSTASTLGSALWANGYVLFASDRLTPPASTPLADGLAATLAHSRLVTIQTQSGHVTVRTAARTVGEALQEAHLSLQGLDYSLPAPDQVLPANGRLRLVRVTEQVLLEQTPIPFQTQWQAVSDLELDSQTVVQAGEYGITEQRLRVRYEDGKEASRKVEAEYVARQPVDRILGYGTMLVMHTTRVDGVTINYWRSLSMYATSYHPSEVGDTTASGMPLKKGVAAVDTSVVPFFTEMYVPGYGQVVAADIGGGVIGRWIDLGYSDNDYVSWHSWVTVYFLWPPPDNIVWVVP